MTKYPYRRWGLKSPFLARKSRGLPPPATGTWVVFGGEARPACLMRQTTMPVLTKAKAEIVFRFHNGINSGFPIHSGEMECEIRNDGSGWFIGSYRSTQGNVGVNSAPINFVEGEIYTLIIESALDNTAGPGQNRGFSVSLNGVEILHHTAPWIKPDWQGGGPVTELSIADMSWFGNEFTAGRNLEIQVRSVRWYDNGATTATWQVVDRTASYWNALSGTNSPGYYRLVGDVVNA